MKPWITTALEMLTARLGSPHHELNELDWKSNLAWATAANQLPKSLISKFFL